MGSSLARNTVRVIAGCTHRAGLLATYERQLGAAGIELCLEINPVLKYPNGLRMIGAHLENLKRWLDQYGDCENLIFTDAWDVLFYGDAEEVAGKVPGCGVLLAAERNCWPDTYLASSYSGTTPWRYVNGGLLAAKPENLARWLEAMERHPAYHPAVMDQQWLNHRRLEGSPLTPIDHVARLFYCMCLEAGELQGAKGRPHNTVTENYPNFIHFNGKADSTMFLWKMATSAGAL